MERFSFGIADLYPCQNTWYNGSSLPPVWMRPACHDQEFASNWIGRIGVALVKLPIKMVKLGVSAGQYLVSGDSSVQKAKKLHMPTSIDTLSPKNRFVRTLNRLPIADRIPYHSIVGDRGRGDTPDSSDGVVAYRSSHLDGAQSEKVVPSGHPAHQNPQGMEEIDRILRLNLRGES
jgi:hypothetical protein